MPAETSPDAKLTNGDEVAAAAVSAPSKIAEEQAAKRFRVGRIYRYARPYSPTPAAIDGLPNYFSVVATSGRTLALLEAGVNPIQSVIAPDGLERCPAILLSTSPHKVGSSHTPWEDSYDIDNGSIRYFGDNKGEKDPAEAKGNAALLFQLALHSSQEASQRARAAPILFFRRVTVGGRQKGNVQFMGLAVLRRAERVTQFARSKTAYFTNYAFEFVVIDLSQESETLAWEWIAARRDSSVETMATASLAPAAWKRWIRDGQSALERCRRRVSRLLTEPTKEQVPAQGSAEERALRTIYEHYDRQGRRLFEHLASLVVERIMVDAGNNYRTGWVTPYSGDGGADFIGRLDVGTGFATTRVVVLGQAKCEKLDAPTGGNHIARTVARLKRGWIGAYVTTSYFSERVQMEVVEDQYPIMLVHGLQVARTVLAMANQAGHVEVRTFLESVDARSSNEVHIRRPEEILRD